MSPSVHDSLLADLVHELQQSVSAPVFVGFSGGVDSSLLLTLCCRAFGADQVTAIHINHGLSDQASDWSEHCEHFCASLGCGFQMRKVTVNNQGKGLEAEARKQRYEAFSDVLPASSCLLLGQHLDDQVETFFLRLFRGAGVHGLQGMSRCLDREHYRIFRPLLNIFRQDIEALAEHLSLVWLEDESNKDTRFDRNFLRQEVLPLIETRWPGYRDRVRQTQLLLGSAREHDESGDIKQELSHRLSHDQGLKMVQLDQLSRAQILSLLHLWLTSIGQPVPSKDRLEVILDQVVHARADARPEVQVGEGTVRRHGPALYWVADTVKPEAPPSVEIDRVINWPGIGTVQLARVDTGPRLRLDLPHLRFGLRTGNETLRPYGRSRSRDLKRLLQEYRIKPWLRDRMPLLFSNDTLVAAGDDLISAEHLADDSEPGLVLNWQESD